MSELCESDNKEMLQKVNLLYQKPNSEKLFCILEVILSCSLSHILL